MWKILLTTWKNQNSKWIELFEKNLVINEGTLIITNKISPIESSNIEKILNSEWLSTYLFKKEDFIILKNLDEIVWCWRIYKLPMSDKDVVFPDIVYSSVYLIESYELSSIWIAPTFRWNKLWLIVVKELIYRRSEMIAQGNKNIELFLATNNNLAQYYWELWFIVTTEHPYKFVETITWANSKWIEAVVMKLC
jgi:hypothetical protein